MICLMSSEPGQTFLMRRRAMLKVRLYPSTVMGESPRSTIRCSSNFLIRLRSLVLSIFSYSLPASSQERLPWPCVLLPPSAPPEFPSLHRSSSGWLLLRAHHTALSIRQDRCADRDRKSVV